jgi:hypothetical protein
MLGNEKLTSRERTRMKKTIVITMLVIDIPNFLREENINSVY